MSVMFSFAPFHLCYLFALHPAKLPSPSKCSKLPSKIPVTTVARFDSVLDNQNPHESVSEVAFCPVPLC